MDNSKIITKRLILRKPSRTDRQALFEIHGDPNTNRFNPYGPHKSVEESETMLRKWLEHWQKYDFGYWVITTRTEPHKIIGCGGLMYKQIAHARRANLYFRFRTSAWGKGYATEMAKMSQQLGFKKLGLQQIAALVRPDNKPSIRLLERLGMIQRGIIKDKKGSFYFYVLDQNTSE